MSNMDEAAYKTMEEGRQPAPKATTYQQYPTADSAPAGSTANATAYAGVATGTYVPTAVATGASAYDGPIVTVYYVAEGERPDKMLFVRKVFGILTLQLLVTFSIVLAFFITGCKTIDYPNNVTVNCTDNSPRTVVQDSAWIIWVVLVGWIVVYIICVCAQLKCRNPPWNYLILSTFTVFTGVFLGVLACYASLVEVAIAILLTILVSVSVIGLTCCSFTNGFVGPAPFVAVGVLSIFWTCCMFLPFAFVGGFGLYTYYNVLWSGLGVILFSLFLIYDTAVILNGTHRKIKFRANDHCLAALSLYLDIVNLFICLVSNCVRACVRVGACVHAWVRVSVLASLPLFFCVSSARLLAGVCPVHVCLPDACLLFHQPTTSSSSSSCAHARVLCMSMLCIIYIVVKCTHHRTAAEECGMLFSWRAVCASFILFFCHANS
jgi:FtsH-binding integral membrane protein